MLTKVQFENYRGFKSYPMEGLKRVNLFVGKNGSGKTAALEGIQFLTSAGNPAVLAEAADRRGELVVRRNGTADTGEDYVSVDIAHFFPEHVISRDACARFAGLVAGGQQIKASARVTEETDQGNVARLVLEIKASASVPEETDQGNGARLVLEHANFERDPKRFRITHDGSVDLPSEPSPWELVRTDYSFGRKGVFIGPESANSLEFLFMWNELLSRGRELDVAAVLRVLDQNVESVQFLAPTSTSARFPARGGVVVGLKGRVGRVPLGSLGDGMRRLLALATSLAFAKVEPLFVDEIDSGLHYSVMRDMWKIVVTSAKASGTQVFATTHSWDCLDGLSQFCREEPDLAGEVAMHKISTVLPHSAPFTGESLGRMLRSDIDPR